MKRIIAAFLAMIMIFTLGACAGQDGQTKGPGGDKSGPKLSADGKYPENTIKIGFVNYDTTATQVLALQEYFEYLQTAFNFEIVWSESLDSAESELEFIEQCAAAGCKAIIGYYNEAKDESVKLCESLGMYYWGGAEISQIYDNMKTSEYYLGGYYTGNAQYDFGYAMAQAMVDNDCHKIIVMSGGKDYGVEFFVERYNGVMDGIADAQKKGYDIEVVYEVPGWPGTEEFAAHQTSALETDADGLIGTLTSLMWIQPMQNAGKFEKIKIASIDTVSEDMAGLMDAGVYVCVCNEIIGVFGMAIPMIINAVEGYNDLQRDADGNAPRIDAANWVVTSAEDMRYYASIEREGGTWTFDIDDIKSLLGAYNPDLSVEDISALYTAVSSEEIKARRAD